MTSVLADQHYRAQQRLSRQAAQQVQTLWNTVAGETDVRAGFTRVLPRLVAIVAAAQLLAAAQADTHASAELADDDQQLAGPVDAAMLAGVASDGRTLQALLAGGLVAFSLGHRAGLTRSEALLRGEHRLVLAAATQVADAGRAADGVAVISHGAAGYHRQLVPPACGRCAILAGRFYRWNAAFRRHPRCDCTYAPTADAGAPSTFDPAAYFASLTATEQDRLFGPAAAQAIRDGADPAQVVNAARGTDTATRPGTTTQGTTRRGWYAYVQRALDPDSGFARAAGTRLARTTTPRLMPEQIYARARDRGQALRLLKANGYFLDGAAAGPHPLARLAAELLAT